MQAKCLHVLCIMFGVNCLYWAQPKTLLEEQSQTPDDIRSNPRYPCAHEDKQGPQQPASALLLLSNRPARHNVKQPFHWALGAAHGEYKRLSKSAFGDAQHLVVLLQKHAPNGSHPGAEHTGAHKAALPNGHAHMTPTPAPFGEKEPAKGVAANELQVCACALPSR